MVQQSSLLTYDMVMNTVFSAQSALVFDLKVPSCHLFLETLFCRSTFSATSLAREFSFVTPKEDVLFDSGAGRAQPVTSLNSAQIWSTSHCCYVHAQKVSREAGGAATSNVSVREN